jgi:dynein heavy chain
MADVRHGLMIVGPTGTGKSCVLRVLQNALTDTKVQHKVIKLNPKAITDQELYGTKIEISDEWIPGVFSTIFQKYNKKNLKFNTWIIFDGPVDTIWIESLNSVLDDSRLLTLANNDRIPMTDNTKLIIEPENLNNASPATVSRCGIIFMSITDLTWEPLIEAWVNFWSSSAHENRPEEADAFKNLIDTWFREKNILTACFKECEIAPSMPLNENVLTSNFLSLLSAVLKSFNEASRPEAHERIVMYCLSWSVGGLLIESDRPKWT